MNTLLTPLESLRFGQWFKLICGASYQDVSKIRNLSLVFSLAGADCIDVAADPAVVKAALAGINVSQSMEPVRRPWLMVSFNDGQDPHFRKAWFDTQRCPPDCSRPCEQICPANAILPIALGLNFDTVKPGVVSERCYGCGRCLPVCPYGLVEERRFTVAAVAVLPALMSQIDAIEIHTQMGRQDHFQALWQQLASYIPQLKLVAVSCPDKTPKSNAIADYLAELHQRMDPKPSQLLWQTDGRPMSGDIGRGTTRATIRLAEKVLNARLPGYVQLAGGTNDYTVAKLRSLNLLKTPSNRAGEAQTSGIHGIAYGSYARRLVSVDDTPLETMPEELWRQVRLATELVNQIKRGPQQTPTQTLRQSNYSHQTPATIMPP